MVRPGPRNTDALPEMSRRTQAVSLSQDDTAGEAGTVREKLWTLGHLMKCIRESNVERLLLSCPR